MSANAEITSQGRCAMTREQAEQIARSYFGPQDSAERARSVAVLAILEAVAIEREACAKVCEEHTITPRVDKTRDPYITTLQCAAAIRARGDK